MAWSLGHEPRTEPVPGSIRMNLNVLSVASEVYPLVKTGGLADVAGALPAALKPEGAAIRTLVPGLPGRDGRLRGCRGRG